MKNNIHSTDGFIVRRRAAGGAPNPTGDSGSLPKKFLDGMSSAKNSQVPIVERRQASDLGSGPVQTGSAMPDALSRLDLNLETESAKPTEGLKKEAQKQKAKRKWPVKRIVKIVAIFLLVAGVSYAGYLGYKLIATGGQIFKGNIVNAVFAPAKRLAADANGRTNVLLFGTSEDDPDHAGADLTDSMMIVSANQDTKEAFLISVPRDLYVDYGRACPAGYQGKLNALYVCVKDSESEEAAHDALRKKIGDIFGLDVQYAAHVNYAALREAVDAVGGITVNIDSSDSRGILDRNFDWDCPKGRYTCYNVKYPNGPANLDGKHALYLARARGANGDTYGLPQANFDREKYQREILIALKDKAVNAGTLANPLVVNGLLETLGKNVRTNFSVEEIKTLVDLAQKVDTANIASLQLNDPEGPLVTTANINGQSVVRPVKGLYEYSAMQKVVNTYATGDKASLEKAVIDVFNASSTAGLATTMGDKIKDEGLIVGTVANAAKDLNTEPIQVYDLSGGKKPATRQKLQSITSVTVKDEPAGGITGISSSADFVVIIGTPSDQ